MFMRACSCPRNGSLPAAAIVKSVTVPPPALSDFTERALLQVRILVVVGQGLSYAPTLTALLLVSGCVRISCSIAPQKLDRTALLLQGVAGRPAQRSCVYEGSVEVSQADQVAVTASFRVTVPLLYPCEISEVHLLEVAAATSSAKRTRDAISKAHLSAIEAWVNGAFPPGVHDDVLAWQMSALTTRITECAAETATDVARLRDTAARYLASRQALQGRLRISRSCIGHS